MSLIHYHKKAYNGPATVSDDNPLPVRASGSSLVECKTEQDAVDGVVTFDGVVRTIEIYNTDSTNTGVFSVSGLDITVPPNTPFFATVEGPQPSNQVSISGTTTYIINRYE